MLPISRDFARKLVEDELSYSIQRPYPYGKQFKIWVFVVSFFIMGGLTVVNVATNGFDKQLDYTSNPNETESKKEWYNHKIFTWGDDTLEPKCQNENLPVGHEFLTTNLGLKYKIKKIEKLENGTTWQKPTISYKNNRLTDCELKSVGISLYKGDIAPPSKTYRWTSWVQSTADALAFCTITTDKGQFKLWFSTDYITYVEHFDYIATDNATTAAPFWWGSRLMNTYFVGVLSVMSGLLPDNNDKTPMYSRARLTYELDDENPAPRTAKGTAAWRSWYYFLDANTGERATPETYNIPNSDLFNNPTYNNSRPHTEGLMFAKVFRSLILADLGSNKTENLLLDPKHLQFALNPGPEDFNRIDGGPLASNTKTKDWEKFAGISPPRVPYNASLAVPFHEAYAKFSPLTGKLETKPAQINTEYTCSVPAKKSTSTMFLFTLVANLALFQTVWGILKYLVDQKVAWDDTEGTANYCQGCLDGHGRVVNVEFQDGEFTPGTPATPGYFRKSFHSTSSKQPLLENEHEMERIGA